MLMYDAIRVPIHANTASIQNFILPLLTFSASLYGHCSLDMSDWKMNMAMLSAVGLLVEEEERKRYKKKMLDVTAAEHSTIF